MNFPSADSGVKLLTAIKDFPFWLIAGIAIALNITLFIPEISPELTNDYKGWLAFAAVLFSTLAIARAASIILQLMQARKEAADARRTFHLTPIKARCDWNTSKQADDSQVTFIHAHFMVKNLTQTPLGLVSARIIKPVIRGEEMNDMVLVKDPRGEMYGSAIASGYYIPPSESTIASVSITFRGTVNKRPHETLQVILGIADDAGNEQRVAVDLRGVVSQKSQVNGIQSPTEFPYMIADPIEKDVVSILQSELDRYDKCGRQGGGLGSVHIIDQGHVLAGVGTESWNPRSPKNQIISDNPEGATLQSDNLDAMLVVYAQLSTDDERNNLVVKLLDRIDENKGYMAVSYFIVCALWKMGHLHGTLQKVKNSLPQGEKAPYGLSNVLMLLNGLLRYRHPDFTMGMLDDIEEFVHDMDMSSFKIAEKTAAIRTIRAARPADIPN